MSKMPVPEPIDVVAELLPRYSPAGIVALCRRVAEATGDARGPRWTWQLREVARIALLVEDWIATHKAGH